MKYIMESLSEASANRFVIPESCLSFSEMSTYLDEFTNKEFNSMLESIGIDELTIFESTGSVVVYEAEKLESLKTKVSEHMKDIWAAYKGFWEKVLATVKQDTAYAKKLGKLTVNSVKNIDAEKTYGKTHTFFAPNSIKFDAAAVAFAKNVNKAYKGLSEEETDNIKKATEMLADVICSKISGVDAKSNKAMKSELSKKLMGEAVTADGAWVKKNYNKMVVVVEGGMLDQVKAAYNAEKKVFAEITAMTKSIDNSVSSIIEPWCKMLGTTVSVMHACYAVEMDVCRRELREYVIILSKVLGNKPVHECTDPECQTAEITGECPAAQEVEAGGANKDAMPDNKVKADAEGSEKKLEEEPIKDKEDAAVKESVSYSKQFDMVDKVFNF